MTGRDRAALLDVREWSGDPLGFPRVVESPYRMSESGL